MRQCIFKRVSIGKAFLAVFLVCSLGQSVVQAQTASHPDSVSPLKPNPYLKHNDPWRWDIRSQVFLQAGYYYRQLGVYREEVSGSWDLHNFEYIFPVVRQGGHYWSPNQTVEASLRIDDARYTPIPQIFRTPDSHVQYAWWKSNQRDAKTHRLHFMQLSHIVAADTVFQEELAKEIPWPAHWPEEAERFLTPIVDRVADPINIQGQDHLSTLVNQWLQGNDPRSIDQVTLAKFLTGKVIEHVQVSGPSTTFLPTLPLSVLSDTDVTISTMSLDSWTGFFVRSADEIALEPNGTNLDLAMFLTAVLRTAGVPARTVVCYDNAAEIYQGERIVAIVEFAMYDQARDQILWIPVDPKLLKDNGRRSNVYKQRWDYFGTHDRLHDYVPLAYYFHPPVKYKSYAYPGFFGFRTKPDIGDRVTQRILIDVINTPTRGDEARP